PLLHSGGVDEDLMKRTVVIGLATVFALAACSEGTSPGNNSTNKMAEKSRVHATAGDVIGQATNGFYTVFVNQFGAAGIGQYTVMTGPNHPVTLSTGSPKNVIFGNGSPGTSYNTIHSFTTNTDYVNVANAAGAGIFVLDPLHAGVTATVVPLGTIGYRTTYVLSGPPNTPDKLTIIEDVATHGTTFETATVEVTTTVTNNGAAPTSIGIRYLWDVQIGEDDGPTFQQLSPDAAVTLSEKSFTSPSFGFFRIQDNDGNATTPLFSVFGTVTQPNTISPVPTPPDLLENVSWPDAVTKPFAYAVTPGKDVSSATGSINDNAILYFWGSSSANAIVLNTSASRTVSQSLVSAEANAPPPFNQQPTATITSPANSASFVSGATVSFAGTGVDPEDGTLTGASLVWTDGATQIGTGTSFSLSTLAVGTHVITLTATDSKGAKGTATVTIVITGVPVDQHPTATITSPANSASFVQGASVGFAGSGHDAEDGTLTGASLVWTDGATQIGTGTSFSLTTLAVGTHVITLTAKDSKAQTGTASVTITVTAPAQNQAPTAQITSPSNGAVIAPGASISFAGTGTDPEDGALSGASLVWTDNVSGQIGTGTSFSLATLAGGPHIITLTATDSKGAHGTATMSFTIAFSQSIGSAGGSLCVESCHLSLFFPQGALSSTTTFFVWTTPAPTPLPGLIGGAAYVVSPAVTFAVTGELGIKYDPATLPSGVSQSTLRLYRYVAGSWQLIPNGGVNTTSHIVFAPVSGTGIFAIASTP
ncbi:MAG: hypothetical protein ABI884_04780, partial [Gemmatimonadota bacterium]